MVQVYGCMDELISSNLQSVFFFYECVTILARVYECVKSMKLFNALIQRQP